MARSETTARRAEKAWTQVGLILENTTLDLGDLYEYVGYSSETALKWARSQGHCPSKQKCRRISALFNAKDEAHMRSIIDRVTGVVANNKPEHGPRHVDPWGSVTVAAAALVDAVNNVAGGLPEWAMSDEIRKVRGLASQIHQITGGDDV